MADSKITGLTADTAPTTDDLVVTVNDPGGTPANRKVTVANFMTAANMKNPYKFRCSRNAAANTGNGAFAAIAFDTEQFDTGGNVSSGVFTAPVDGFYQFSWGANAPITTAGQTIVASLFVGGTENTRGSQVVGRGNGDTIGSVGSCLIQLSATNTVDVRVFGSAAFALAVGNTTQNYFSGFLVSIT